MKLRDIETGKLYLLKEIAEDMELNVAFVVGHCDIEEGAVFSGTLNEEEESMAFSQSLDESEYDFWEYIAKTHLEFLGDVFTHDNLSSYGRRQYNTAQKTKAYDLVFELHFNAASPSAEGAEGLYYEGNEKTRLICEKFSSLMASKMGYKNRGAKGLTEGSRGHGFVSMQKPPAIILEPFFGTNKQDCLRFNEHMFVEVIQELIEYSATILK